MNQTFLTTVSAADDVFDAGSKSGERYQQIIKNIRKQILKTMYQSKRSKLTGFVLRETDKLGYDRDEKDGVMRSRIYVLLAEF